MSADDSSIPPVIEIYNFHLRATARYHHVVRLEVAVGYPGLMHRGKSGGYLSGDA